MTISALEQANFAGYWIHRGMRDYRNILFFRNGTERVDVIYVSVLQGMEFMKNISRCSSFIRIFSLFLFVFSLSAVAQDEPSALLKWYPRAEYSGVLHYDAVVFAQRDLGFLHKLMTQEVLRDIDINDIPTLHNTYDSVTLALAGRIFLDRGTGEVKTLEKSEGFLFFFNVMAVFRYSNLDEQITQVLERNYISPTRIKLFDRPVYSYKPKEGNELFLYATSTGELLMATNKRVVVAMVRAGMGGVLGILDEETLADLPYIIPESPLWAVLTNVHEKHMEIDRLRDKGEEESKLEAREEKLEGSAQFTIATIELDKDIIYRETLIFTDSEAAEEAFRNDSYDKLGTPFPEESIKKTKRSTEGNRIIETTRHDVEALRKQITTSETSNE
jgi:hypothetical protein